MKQMIKKILCPYDGTASSEFAFKNILTIAKNLKAEIFVLTCIRDKTTLGFFKLNSDRKLMTRQKKNAEKKIERLQKQAEKLGVSIKSKIVNCEIISKKIIEQAKKEEVDTIAMSKTKRGTAAEKMYSQSTVEMVFKESPCSFIHLK